MFHWPAAAGSVPGSFPWYGFDMLFEKNLCRLKHVNVVIHDQYLAEVLFHRLLFHKEHKQFPFHCSTASKKFPFTRKNDSTRQWHGHVLSGNGQLLFRQRTSRACLQAGHMVISGQRIVFTLFYRWFQPSQARACLLGIRVAFN
jgi:hypothetical protein